MTKVVINVNEFDQNLGSIGRGRPAVAGAIDGIGRDLEIGVVEIGVVEEIGPETDIVTVAETETLLVEEVVENHTRPDHRLEKRWMLIRASLINNLRTAELGTVNMRICSRKR
jgi:hypothetical protein